MTRRLAAVAAVGLASAGAAAGAAERSSSHRLVVETRQVLEASSGTYAARLPSGPFLVTRGWTAADVKHRGRTVRVVNTHLEAFHEGIRFAQAAGLAAGPGGNPAPTILLGDFNSGPPAPTPTYGLPTSAFTDVWAAVGAGPGLTCCHPDLTPSTPFSKRIDLVLVDGGIAPRSAEVIGGTAAAGFPFYPSDHGGVVATVKLP